MKPIKVKYKSITFHSRLEARWAVFFDALGVNWFYEYEGYPTKQGNYLPDFWLPEVYLRSTSTKGILFEVKPDNFGFGHESLEEVANNLKVGAILARGFTLDSKYGDWGEDTLTQIAPWWDNYMMIYPCRCGTVKFEFSAESRYRNCPRESCSLHDDQDSISRVIQAYKKAIAHKFG